MNNWPIKSVLPRMRNSQRAVVEKIYTEEVNLCFRQTEKENLIVPYSKWARRRYQNIPCIHILVLNIVNYMNFYFRVQVQLF